MLGRQMHPFDMTVHIYLIIYKIKVKTNKATVDTKGQQSRIFPLIKSADLIVLFIDRSREFKSSKCRKSLYHRI